MTGKRAFLFDMDGTLVDSLGDIGNAMNHVLAELGQPTHALEAYRTMVGEGAASLIARALPGERSDLRDRALAAYKAQYSVDLLRTSRLYDGVEALLEALSARGDALGIVTNKPQPAAEIIARGLFRSGLFGVVLGESPLRPKKPDAAPALAAAVALGVEPARCVFVGDTAIDIETARAAGMTSVGVLWGFRDRAELEGARAQHVVARPEAILDL